ncbi:MAG: glycosyltransferase, partial [Planctomycetes bacterium]|nr:glycosyltransferase [Planctomycetota bacterium]
MTFQNDLEVRPRPAPPTVGDAAAGSQFPGQTATAGKTPFDPELTSIIIAQKNTWSEFTGPLIEQLRKLTAEPYEIIVVDNGSDADQRRALAAASASAGFRLILNPTNLGWARANNQGLAAAGGRYVCLFNSDVSVNEPQWNRKAMQFLQRRPNCCALGLSKTAGSAFFHTDGSHTGPPGQQPCITEAISGATLFADRRRTGDFRFDEAYPWWFEETDMCFQWRAAGWKLMRLPLEIHHLGEQTVRRESDSQSRIEY